MKRRGFFRRLFDRFFPRPAPPVVLTAFDRMLLAESDRLGQRLAGVPLATAEAWLGLLGTRRFPEAAGTLDSARGTG